MKKLTTFIGVILLVVMLCLKGKAQQQLNSEDSTRLAELETQTAYVQPGNSRFLLRGYAHAGAEYSEEDLSFVGGNFNPILIYRQSDRLLFEGELEIGYDHDEFEIGLEYANISYILSPIATLRLGKMFVPFGIFTERIHPAWINKFPTAPLGYGHDGNLPGTDVGAELRGGVSGPMKFNYSIYLINGPQLNDGSEHEDDAGKLVYGKIVDNNKNKAIGGRLGIFPFSNSMLELGFSGQFGKVAKKDTPFEDVKAQLYAVDLTFVRNLNFMKSVVDIKGQANWMKIDEANYIDHEDTTGTGTYTFENNSNAYFAQVSIRPALIDNNFIRNLELAGRYSAFRGAEGALWEVDQSQWALSLNYWLDWRTVFKVTFQASNQKDDGHGEPADEHDEEAFGGNLILFHWAIGF